MPSTHKKVVVRKMDRDSINGFVAPANFVHEGKLELLNTSGNVVAIDYGTSRRCILSASSATPIAQPEDLHHPSADRRIVGSPEV